MVVKNVFEMPLNGTNSGSSDADCNYLSTRISKGETEPPILQQYHFREAF